MPTLNVTHNNIERHAKTAKTEPKKTTQQQTAPTAQAEKQNSTSKIFFSTQRNPLSA
jgi:hypothetical protein